MHLNDLLTHAVRSGASDIHIKVGSYPMMRVDGTLLVANESRRLERDDTETMAATVLNVEQRKYFVSHQEIDAAYSIPGLGRFRCNVFTQRGTISLVIRVISTKVPSVEALELPDVLKRIAEEERGLVLVTGTTGSGKSTTLAAMIDHINQHRSSHIVTVEDPIEYLHRDHRSIVNQREINVDTKSFAHALRSALRQDPDVILVGEMRDLETVETALLAAETGHLVFSTLHTLDAPESINRIVAVFPPHQQRQVRLQLASVLRAVVSQRLLPRADGRRARRRRRSDDHHPVHPRLRRRQGQDAPDPRVDRRRHVAVRDADLRSAPVPHVQPRHHHVRRCDAVRVEQGRIQAEGAGRVDDLRHGPRRDDARRDGTSGRLARDHAVQQLAVTSGTGFRVPGSGYRAVTC